MAGQEWADFSRPVSSGGGGNGTDVVAEAGVTALQATAPVQIPGIIKPAGWNTRYKALRAANATTLVEVTFHGDSTTYGQVGTQTLGSAGEYSYVNKIRALSIAAGYADGGQGLIGLQDNAAMSGADNIATPIVLGGGASAASNAGSGLHNMHGPYGVNINAVGNTVTVTTKASKLRVWRSRTGTTIGTPGGSFTYQVDGGSVSAAVSCQNTSASNYDMAYTVLNLGSAGTTHTVVFTNTVVGPVELAFDAINATGMVYHKQGISGVLLGNEFPSQDTTGAGKGEVIPPRFGLGLGSGVLSQVGSAYGSGMVKTAGFRTGLHVLNLGLNDLMTASSLADARTRADTLASGVAMFCHYLENAGSDGVVLIPHFLYASGQRQYEGLFRSAIINTALGFNVAIGDLGVALGGWPGYTTYGTSVHLNQAGYDVQGQFIFDNFINAA
jgi:hypothetical protein